MAVKKKTNGEKKKKQNKEIDEEAAKRNLTMPSVKTSSISISFPFSSVAFEISKLAKMDTVISQICRKEMNTKRSWASVNY